jgi:hypothetical protein
MIKMLRIYSKAFLENVTIEELILWLLFRREKCQFSPTFLRASTGVLQSDKLIILGTFPIPTEKVLTY